MFCYFDRQFILQTLWRKNGKGVILMIDKGQIQDQIQIAKTILNSDKKISETEWANITGYIEGLSFALGETDAKFDKEDI